MERNIPTYEYECSECRYTEEVLVPSKDLVCSKCKSHRIKLIAFERNTDIHPRLKNVIKKIAELEYKIKELDQAVVIDESEEGDELPPPFTH